MASDGCGSQSEILVEGDVRPLPFTLVRLGPEGDYISFDHFHTFEEAEAEAQGGIDHGYEIWSAQKRVGWCEAGRSVRSDHSSAGAASSA